MASALLERPLGMGLGVLSDPRPFYDERDISCVGDLLPLAFGVFLRLATCGNALHYFYKYKRHTYSYGG